MFENLRRSRQARNFPTNVPKILDLKSSSEQVFSKNWRWVTLTLEPVKITPDLLPWPFFLSTIRFSNSGREGKYISWRELEITTHSSYYYSMWVKTDVPTFNVCLHQRSSNVTWNYTLDPTLRRWIIQVCDIASTFTQYYSYVTTLYTVKVSNGHEILKFHSTPINFSS